MKREKCDQIFTRFHKTQKLLKNAKFAFSDICYNVILAYPTLSNELVKV